MKLTVDQIVTVIKRNRDKSPKDDWDYGNDFAHRELINIFKGIESGKNTLNGDDKKWVEFLEAKEKLKKLLGKK